MSEAYTTEAKLYCSSCNSMRPRSAFILRADGSRRKTCFKHAKAQHTCAHWEDVLRQLNSHTQAVHPVVDIDVNLRYQDSPVPIASGFAGESLLISARLLSRAIWDASGFRFAYLNTRKSKDACSFFYHCAQDIFWCKDRSSGTRRSGESTASIDCGSRLMLSFKPVAKVINICLKHSVHEPYNDRSMPIEAIEFIEQRLDSTPRQIFQDLVCSLDLGARVRNVTQKQVWFWWRMRTSSVWNLHPDHFESMSLALQGCMLSPNDGPSDARALLDRYIGSYQTGASNIPNQSIYGLSSAPGVFGQQIVKEGSIRGFALFSFGIIAAIRHQTVEISLDATYGTNNSGHDLFGVLAELEGTGVPLMYLFMDTKNMYGDGRKIEILAEGLAMLKGMGLSPQFVGCDKDVAEISAIHQTWPEAKVQLCYWHVRRALRQRFSNGRATSTTSYHWSEAAQSIPGIEVCWGVASNRRHGLHVCRCSCRSDTSWDKVGKLEVTKEQSEELIAFISQHYNLHPLFPTLTGVRLNSEQIRLKAATEMYQYCWQRGWARVWAYLWTNWYCPEQWRLWSRSSCGSVPVLKTTMICESHWRTIKHDYLHRFSRPRLDLVAHVLCQRLLPTTCFRLDALLRGDSRLALPSWRKHFASAWKKEENKDVSEEALTQYSTCPHAWLCACLGFLNSRFLICKHLIASVRPVARKELMRFGRQRLPPFWSHQALIPLQQGEECRHQHLHFHEVDAVQGPLCSTSTDVAYGADEDRMFGDHVMLGAEEVEEGEGQEQEDDDEDQDGAVEEVREWADVHASSDDGREDEERSSGFPQALRMIQRIQKLLEREREWDSQPFIRAFMRSNRQNVKLLEEDERRLQRRGMPRTWVPGQHPALMYIKGDSPL